jgi:glutamate-ammonia-ligase adenylyltransferase
MATLSESLAAGPDAEAASLQLERLREAGLAIPTDESSISLLAGLLASGSYLPQLLLTDSARWARLCADPWLVRKKPRDRIAHEVADACAGVRSLADLQRGLRCYAQYEMLRLGVREMGTGLPGSAMSEYGLTLEVARELSGLADACLEAAVKFCSAELVTGYGEPVCNDSAPGFSVIALGKLGGDELNFSSDIDLLYLYASDDGQAGSLSLHEYYARLSKAVTRALSESTSDGMVFRVDLRLRPEGQSGAICNSLRAAESYYETFGRTWERQALLRARPAAGDAWLGDAFLKMVEPFVFPRIGGTQTLDEVRALRRMFVTANANGSWDVKLGTGGIRDVELVAQVLQLLYGGKRPDLRDRTTLPSLSKLALAGLISDYENRTLTDAYKLLRRIEHRLQLEHAQQVHRLPETAEGMDTLARRLGYAGTDEFATVLEKERAAVCAIADTLGEPAAGPPATVLRMLTAATTKEVVEQDLRTAGFRDIEQSSYRLELAHGRMPAEWLEEAIASPDPDRALARFSDLALRASLGLFALLREDRQLLRILAALFGTSERLSRHLITHPELWPRLPLGLGDPTPEATAWNTELAERLRGCDYEAALRELRRFQAEEILRIGLCDVAGDLDPEVVSAQLGRLAEACLRECAQRVATDLMARRGRPACELSILVLGSCGAREMRYGSDLELVFLYEREGTTSAGVEHQEWFARFAQRLLSALGALLEEGRLYTVDTRLRPSGSQGTLVTSYHAFEEYHRERAAPWERVALLRGRVACVLDGDQPSAGSTFAEQLRRTSYERPIPTGLLHDELWRMRSLIERERAGKYLHLRFSPGGLTDFEFMAAWSQLRNGSDDAGLRTTSPLQAIRRLVERGEMDARMLDHYHFLARACLRLRLLRDHADDRLFANDEQPLARSLGFEPPQLLAELENRMADVRQELTRQLG